MERDLKAAMTPGEVWVRGTRGGGGGGGGGGAAPAPPGGGGIVVVIAKIRHDEIFSAEEGRK